MSHNHNNSTTNIKTAFFLNAIFTVIELIGGIYTNSIAIIADALHDFGDSLSLLLSWKLDKYSKKKKDSKFSYGYKRFSLLAAFVNSQILIFGSIFVLYTAVPRMFNPESSNYQGMFILAILGIVVNGIAALRLKKGQSLNEKVITWHLLEDIFGWVAVLVVSTINMIIEMPILDPILAVVFTLFILYNVVKNLGKILNVFLQRVPEEIDIKKVKTEVEKITEVKSVHDIHIWTMDSESHILTIHAVVGSDLSMNEVGRIKKEIQKIAIDMGINHVTVEVEAEDNDPGHNDDQSSSF